MENKKLESALEKWQNIQPLSDNDRERREHLIKGGKAKKIKKKTAQNNQISEKTSLLVKRPSKTCKCQKKVVTLQCFWTKESITHFLKI